MSVSTVVKGTQGRLFGVPASVWEPAGYILPDESRAKFQAFTNAVHHDHVHFGTDIICPVGTPVRAPAAGVVVRTNVYRVFSKIANAYVIARDVWFRYGGGRMLYVAHLSAFSVKEGTVCTAGQIIARSGQSGIATGPHAHIEVMLTTNPTTYYSAVRLNPDKVL